MKSQITIWLSPQTPRPPQAPSIPRVSRGPFHPPDDPSEPTVGSEKNSSPDSENFERSKKTENTDLQFRIPRGRNPVFGPMYVLVHQPDTAIHDSNHLLKNDNENP